MDSKKKKRWIWGSILTVLGLGALGIFLYRENQKNKWLVFRLPRTEDPEKFGPGYWAALHRITAEIPCQVCREDGKKLMIYMHDLVNKKLAKPLYDQENFDYFTQKIASFKA